MNHALKILFAGIGINLCIGVLYAWSVFAKALVNLNGWSNADAGMPYTISIVTFSVGVLISGTLQDHMGPRKLAITGTGMVGLGLNCFQFRYLAYCTAADVWCIGRCWHRFRLRHSDTCDHEVVPRFQKRHGQWPDCRWFRYGCAVSCSYHQCHDCLRRH